jgi:Spy/CpxP family protein refolding chaperone
MKKWYIWVLAVVFLASATTVFALSNCNQGKGRHGYVGHRPGGRMEMCAYLNLSKEQMEKMWQLKEKLRGDTQALRHEIFQKKIEMRSLFANPATDEATLIAKGKDLFATKEKMQERMLQFRIEQRKILTPEQVKKLAERPCGQGSEWGMDDENVGGHQHGGGRCRG